MTTRGKAVLWIVGVFLTGSLFGGFLVVLGMRIAERRLSATPIVSERPDAPPVRIDEGQGPGGRSIDSPSPPQDGSRDGPRHRRQRRERVGFARLMKRLELSPEQRRDVQKILTDTRRRSAAADREAHEQRRRLRTKMLREIRQVLDSEQQARFDDAIRDHLKR